MTDQEIKEVFESYGQYVNGHDYALVRAVEAVVLTKREWVGLTDEEMKKTWYEMRNIMGWYSFQEISKAIEAKLKEKNNG